MKKQVDEVYKVRLFRKVFRVNWWILRSLFGESYIPAEQVAQVEDYVELWKALGILGKQYDLHPEDLLDLSRGLPLYEKYKFEVLNTRTGVWRWYYLHLGVHHFQMIKELRGNTTHTLPIAQSDDVARTAAKQLEQLEWVSIQGNIVKLTELGLPPPKRR